MNSTDIKIGNESIFIGKSFTDTAIKPSDNAITRFYKKMAKEFEEAYYLCASLSIMLQSVLGGIATMMILENSKNSSTYVLQLILSVGICSLYNAFILGQIKPKYVFRALITSVLVSLVLIAINM